MGFWDKLKGELVDVIQWLDDTGDTMVYRFERYGNEIKYGAKLIVRESQVAVFVNEGRIADIYSPGTYTLETKNMPVMTTLNSWMHGFQSPFKAEVYFVSTRVFTSLGWGTKNPIMLRDPEFGPIRLRAFGKFAIRISDPALFVKDITGTNGHFSVEYINEQLRDLIVSRFTNIIGASKIPALDLASNYDELAEFVNNKISPEFNSFGIEIVKLLIENISLPPNVEEALDKRTSMGIIGNLSAYTQFQAANAMEAAAKNPSGGASDGIGMGMGFAMANQMTQGYANQQQQQGSPPPVQPPPMPKGITYCTAINGQQQGPFDFATLQQMAHEKRLVPETMVWTQGMPNWVQASQAPDLGNIFANTPPPLPQMPLSPPPVPPAAPQSAHTGTPARHISSGEKLTLNDFLDSDVLKIGINWDNSGAENYETSVSMLLLSENRKLEKESNFLFYNNLSSPEGSAKLHSSSERPYKESMDLRLGKIPDDVSCIIIALTIDNGEQLNHRFENIRNLDVDFIDPQEAKIEARFIVEGLSRETSVILAEIYRHKGLWKLKACGEGFNKGLEAILREYAAPGLNI